MELARGLAPGLQICGSGVQLSSCSPQYLVSLGASYSGSMWVSKTLDRGSSPRVPVGMGT
jgi:hypothetical protein